MNSVNKVIPELDTEAEKLMFRVPTPLLSDSYYLGQQKPLQPLPIASCELVVVLSRRVFSG